MKLFGAAANGLIALAVALAPPVALSLWAWPQVLKQVDALLASSKPLIEQETAVALERPVRIGRLAPTLSLAALQRALTQKTLTVTAENVELGSRPDEVRWAGQAWLARIPRVTATLSPNALQAGRFSTDGVRAVTVERPELLVYRTSEGKLSVESFLPSPKEPPDLSQSPFETTIKVMQARARFRDFATLIAPGKPVESALERVSVTADLTGTRTLRFAARAYPLGTTATRFSGPLELSGTARRGEPGPRNDSPSRQQPLLSLQATVRNADLAYWLRYGVKPLPELKLSRGRANARLGILLPAETKARPLIQAEVAFAGVDIAFQKPPQTTLVGVGGSATYDGEMLTAAVSGKALGEPFQATGRLVGLEGKNPQLAATVSMPQVPIDKGRALLPALKLPRELSLGSRVTLDGATITGSLQDPKVVARISGIQASWKGLPSITASASIAYRQGTVEATAISAQVAGGGTLTGQGSYTLKSKSGRFTAQLRGAILEKVALLKDLKTPPSGQLAADFTGVLQGEKLSGEGQVQVAKLRIAGLSFPDVAARLALSDKRYQILDGTLSGESGAVRVTGRGELGGALALSAQLVGADLGKLADAFGLPGVGGTISASAEITGTEKAPALLLHDITVLQPRYRFDNHLLVANAAHAERASLRLLPTGQVRIELDPMQPLRVTHSPAVALVSGTITGTKDSARLNLTASAENVEVDEILAQLSDEPGRFAPDVLRSQAGYQELLSGLEWTGIPKPPVSGVVRTAKATITGDAKNPQIEGQATLGRFLLSDFPLVGGTLAFSQTEGALRVHHIQLATATGTVTGEAQLSQAGALSGALVAKSIDLEALSSLGGLVDKQLGITGALSATLTLAGTREHPLLTAQLTEVRPLEIVGLPLAELAIGEVQISLSIREDAPLEGTILLPKLSVRLGGTAARAVVSDLRYEVASQQVSGSVALTEVGFQKVVELLRHAHLDDTEEGRAFIRSLYGVPSSVEATLALTGTLGARLTPDGPRDRRASLRLTSSDLAIKPEGASVTVGGQLAVRATLTDERLSLDSGTLTLADSRSEEPTILRLLSRPDRDPRTGEMTTAKSWLRLPYRKDEKPEYHLTLDTNGIPLDLINSLSPNALPFPIRGKASVTVSADGTAEVPRVTASFYGDNLLLGKTTGISGVFNTPPLLIDQMRFQVDVIGQDDKSWSIALADGRLTHAKEVLTFSGTLPYDPKSSKIAANRPINLQAALDDTVGLTLETLAQYFQSNATPLSGTIRGNLQLTGSLNEPRLGGKFSLTNASARFLDPFQKDKREVINPVQSLNVEAELSGREVRFARAELLLGSVAPPGKPGSKPSALPLKRTSAGRLALEAGSVVRFDNLEDFTRLFVRKDELDADPKLRGEFDLKARFSDFQLDTENATALLMRESLTRTLGGGLEEAFKGKINGLLTIKGPLLTPTIATAPTTHLSLADLTFRIPKRQLPQTAKNDSLAFNPRFEIDLETSNDARLTNPGRFNGFEFKGNGGVTISGDLAAPKIEGVLVPTGGYYQYPLSTFTVQRGGEIRLTYAKRFEAGQDTLQLDIRMLDVVAEGKVLVSTSSARSAQGTPAVFDPNRASSQIPDDLVGKRLTITARFNGLIRMGDPTRDSARTQTNPIRLSSDANVSELTLLSLLVPYQMLPAFVGSNSQQAIRDIGNMVTSGVGQAFLTPVTDQIGRLFGLDSFSLDYSLAGLTNVYLIRRLPEPFDKITIEIRRSFQSRSGTGQLLPQLYGINYEIGQLRRGSRLQIGGSTNEQRDNQLFVKGTFRY